MSAAPQQPHIPQATPVQSFAQDHSPSESEDPAKKKLKSQKPQLAQSGIPSKGNGTQTPVPPQAAHQFHAQNQQGQNAQQSPSPTSQHSPMQPHNYANAQPANEPAKRTPTPAQGRQRYSRSPQVPSSQPAPAPHPPPLPHPQSYPPSLPVFQPAVPSSPFLHQPPQVVRNGQPSTSTSAAPPPPGTSQPNPHAQAQMMYPQHFQHLRQPGNIASQQRLNPPQSSQPTPKGSPLSRSPMGPNQGAAASVRNSPMVSNKPPPSQSPMPPSAQMTQMTPQHLNFAPQYNPAHLRPVVVNGNQSPIPPHLVNGSAPAQGSSSPVPPTASAQDQTQVHPPPMVVYPPMFNYSQVNFGMLPGQPQGYWPPGMGRGIPRGQPMPARPPNTPHPQQEPIGTGKAVQGGLPGR